MGNAGASMALKINDPIPDECTPVGNVPFTMLTGVDGTLQLDPIGAQAPLASEQGEYINDFVNRALTVCNLRGEFCQQHNPLMVDIKRHELGCYIIKQADDPNSELAFSAKVAGMPKITRTSDGKLWAVYTLNYTWDGHTVGAVFLTWSTTDGLSWEGHIKVNQSNGDSGEAVIVADRNDLIHIAYRQFQFDPNPGPITHTDPLAINIHYITFDGETFGSDILVTDMEYPTGPRPRHLSQFTPNLAVDSDNNIHLVFTGEGHVPSDGYGNWPITLQYVMNPSGVGSTTLDSYDYCYMWEPTILIDPQNNYHIVYGADNAIRYIGPETAGYEQIVSRGGTTAFCLLPTIYSDTTLHYNPFLLMISNTNFFLPKLTECQRGESGWVETDVLGFSGELQLGDVTGGVDPNTGISSGPITLTIPDHQLTDGEAIRIYWPTISYQGRQTASVTVIDENTVSLDGTENVVNSFSNSGNWALQCDHSGVVRDAIGSLRGIFHMALNLTNYEGATYMMIGHPGAWQQKYVISDGFFWPAGIQMDIEGSGQYQVGYLFTASAGSGYPNVSSILKVCLSLEDVP